MSMKTAQPRQDHPLWKGLASVRLGVALMLSMIVVSVIGIFASRQKGALSPLQSYTLEQLGLSDVFHSGWFIFILFLLVLNLSAMLLIRWPVIWKQITQGLPHPVNVKQITGAKRSERYVFLDLQSAIPREQFRDFVVKWAKSRVGKPMVLSDEGGLNELQLVSQKGKLSLLFLWLAHLAVVVLLLGAAISVLTSFEGRMTVEEGSKVGFIEVRRGSPGEWPPLKEGGQVIPGFYEPGFEIECSRVDVEYYPETDQPKSISSWLNFTQGGKEVFSRKVTVNHPIQFAGMSFMQSAFARAGTAGAVLMIHDRVGNSDEKIPRAAKGATYKIGASSVKILDVQDGPSGKSQDSGDDLGSALHLEYTEAGQKPESFWIFQRHPGFDPAHRKKSRYTFKVEQIQTRFSSEILVVKDSGAPVVLAGGLLLGLSLVLGLFSSHVRYWFIWSPGRVTLVGWSSKPFLFVPRFERDGRNFQARLTRTDKSAKAFRQEGKRGAS